MWFVNGDERPCENKPHHFLDYCQFNYYNKLMKTKIEENKIYLSPENEIDKLAIKKLQEISIKKCDFENSWDGTGDLVIEFVDPNDWGNNF